MVKCKNCGAEYDDSLSKCPYCSTMHKKGAYRAFRQKISDVIDGVLGLKDEVNRSVSRAILFSVLRALAVVAVCLLLAFVAARMTNVNYYNDRKYDQERYEVLLWEEENFGRLDEAYAAGDLDTVDSIIYSNYHGAKDWEHYDSFQRLKAYSEILRVYDRFGINEDCLCRCMYFLFHPTYNGDLKKLNNEDMDRYLENKANVLELLNEHGYSEEELLSIYDSLKDNWGYLDSKDLAKYLKGENDG